MLYREEYGKKLTHRHLIQMRDDKVWDYYIQNTEAFDNWMKPEVKDWLDALEPVAKYSWLPRWSPWKPTLSAWVGARPYTSLSMMVNAYGSGSGYIQSSVANIRFARREDAMKFKLVWA